MAYDSSKWDETIGTQKCLALFLDWLEAFSDWRRTGLPMIEAAANCTTSGKIPRRFLYPESDRDYNSANMPIVTILEKVWWDQ